MSGIRHHHVRHARVRKPIFDLEPIEQRVLMASVAGQFFYDFDGDGIKDAGDTGTAAWTVFLDENQNGVFDGTSTTVPSSNVPLPVPPGAPTTTSGQTLSTNVVAGIGNIADLNVSLDITHTYNSDLDIFLVSPVGTRIELTTDNGSSGDGMNLTFDDEASQAITSAPTTGPITGSWRPEGLLSAVDGQNADGTWTLEINDDAGGDYGTINSWSLTFSSGERSSTSTANGTYSFLNLAAGTYDVRQISQAGFNQTAPAGGFHTLILDVATNATNIDFGNRQPPGTISGTVFSDYDSSGAQNGSEPGLAGWTVYIDTNDSGTLDAGERSATTGVGGDYSFADLAPGSYLVRHLLQPGYVQTYPTSGGVILTTPGAPEPAGNGTSDFVGNSQFTQTEIVVAFKGSHGKGALKQQLNDRPVLRSLVDYGTSRNMFTVDGVTLVEVRLRGSADPQKTVDAFAALGKVKWAQVNYIYNGDPREMTPNDPQYGSQYHHPLMENNLAWDTTQGDPRVVIGVTDDGNDFEHEDLYLNVWVNNAEIPATRLANLTDLNADGYISFEELNNPVNMGAFKANDMNSDGRITGSDLLAAMVKDGGGADTGAGGWTDAVDQGSNGFADDIVGRDVNSNDNDSRPPSASDSHGTHVMGIAAARTNNGVGVAGTAGRATIMPIRFYGTATWTSTIISNAYHYGTDNGADIITTSYNVDSFANDSIFRSALNYMYAGGVLHFNSAGNNGALNPPRQKFDQSLYIVNTTSTDTRSSTSNYGWGVDATAPGTNILSTYPNNSYQSISGTSMSTPNAAGVAALIWSLHPTWTREQVAAQLLGSADNIDAQNPTLVGLLGAGRVNSNKALTTTIAAPRVKSLGGLPAEGGSTLVKPASFTLDVASVFDPATMTLGSFEMRGDGVDDIFGTADDTLIPLTLVFGGDSAASYMVGTNRLFFSVPGAMPADKYRFSMLPSATDPFGQALDGDGNGTGGDAYTRTFNISVLTNKYTISLDPAEVVANANFGNHDVITPKINASDFGWQNPQALEFTFTEDVSASLSVADLEVFNLTTSLPVDTSAFTLSYNPVTNTATFSVNGILPNGDLRATVLAANLGDPSGNLLDGNSNGTGGDNFTFDFFFLQGDANRDRKVDSDDFNILATNFGLAGQNFSHGNFNYDPAGVVDSDDFNLLATNFGVQLGAGGEASASHAPARSALAATTGPASKARTRSPFSQTRIGALLFPGQSRPSDVLIDERTGQLIVA